MYKNIYIYIHLYIYVYICIFTYRLIAQQDVKEDFAKSLLGDGEGKEHQSGKAVCAGEEAVWQAL